MDTNARASAAGKRYGDYRCDNQNSHVIPLFYAKSL
jgi:hypothetical protein